METTDDTWTVVKINTPADILGMLPYRVGFHPRESLVVLSLHGPRLRDKLVMRFDLPAPRHDAALCADVVARLTRRGADGAVVVCYTDGPAPAFGLARAPLLRTLRSALRRHDIRLVDALLVRDGRWWSFVCRDDTCCPQEGAPVPTVLSPAASLYAAESVARGAVVRPDREALVASIETTEDDEREAAADTVVEKLTDLALEQGGAAVERLTLEAVGRLISRWEVGERSVDPTDALTIAFGLRPKPVRDRAMTLVLDHDPQLLSALFAELVRLTPDMDAAAVCTVLGWFAYASGDGALALVAAERALRNEPGYEMARLIAAGLEAMQPPSVIREISARVRADLEAEVTSEPT